MRRRLKIAAGVMIGTVLGGSAADAQTSTAFERNIDIQRFRVAPGPGNFLTVDGARVRGHMAFSVGAFASYASHPLTIYGADCPNAGNDDNCSVGAVRSRPVEHLGTLNLLASLTLFNRLQIGIDLPLSVESGNQVAPDGNTDGRTENGAAIADPRLLLKARILGEGREGAALAVSLYGQFPTGRWISNHSFLGDTTFSMGARLIGEYRRGRLAGAVNAGVVIRPAGAAQIFSMAVGDRITFGLAGSYELTPRIAVVAEMFGGAELASSAAQQQMSLEVDAAARYRLGDVTVSLGAGAGLVRGLDSPPLRVFLGAMYSPHHADTDHDGVYDENDRCAGEAEDRDGFEDADGCADPDNDGDGINDEADRCPNEPEDRDNFQDADGCPDPDNDGDHVPDGFDACPLQPEDLDGDHDQDGCPDDDRDRDGIADALDRCPTDAEDTDGFQDEDGCPDPDNDGDGVADVEDQCSEQSETRNGYLDEDGCPDATPDRDQDGVADDRDQCPDGPETYDGVTDEDGCPEGGPNLVQFDGQVLRPLQPVNFQPNGDRIVHSASFRVLDAVIAVLRAHPEIARVDVQGHTDHAGNAVANRELSRRRASAVRAYLIAHGIDAARLDAHGFGPDRPLEPNTTPLARARNRRVEFHLGGSASSPEPATPAVTPVVTPVVTPAETPAPRRHGHHRRR